jgi:hypothetical protein
VSAKASWGGWYPQISAGADFTMDRRALYKGKRVYWNEWQYRGGLNLPLNLSKGRNISSVNIGADYIYNKSQFTGFFKDSFATEPFSYINSYIIFNNQIQKARQHIYPRFAETLTLNYRNSFGGLDRKQFLASGNIYLPGFFINHNIILSAAFHQRDSSGRAVFSNNFPFSRGYVAENLYQMVKAGFNYHFPLVYPDYGIGNIVYLLRLRSNLFYDHTQIADFASSRKRVSYNFRSAGAELFFDTKWWNQLPVTAGFRYSYLLDNDLFGGNSRNRFEFILPVNLIR